MDAESLLKGLNSDQRAAVLHDHDRNGQLLILAGAGSGKTSVLTKRIQYRIMCGVKPESILALTFTAKAAAEMRERVQQLFPDAGVRLCTFHSLALHMLKSKIPGPPGSPGKFAYQVMGFKKVPVPMESSSREFLRALSKLKLKSGRVSREMLFSDEYGSIAKKLEPLRRSVLESGQVVFEDLIYLSISLLESNEEARYFFQEQWKEILVDEYQDINPSQYRLVKNLLGNRRQLFVVGDDDQAIYGFRGADIGNINRFRDDFKESSLIRLEWNYRSVPNILRIANEIFVNKPLHLQKFLRAGNLNGSGGNPLYRENRKPEVWISEDPVEEMRKIVLSIKQLRESYDLKWENFAILVRYNRQRLYYVQALKDYSVPVAGESVLEESSGDNAKETSEVEGVHVETVHASKGLQYAVVFYAGLAETLTPGRCEGSFRQRRKQMEEERRLYYVGVTRAEACLFLLYCKRRFWKGRMRRFKRSRFLPCSENRSKVRMPFILYKLYILSVVLVYMAWQFIKVPYVRIRYGKDARIWIDRKIQDFARFCMKVLRVDLTIENQAMLGKVDWTKPVFVVGNHNSLADIPIVFLAIQKTIGFVAKQSLGRIPFLNFWMSRIGCVFVNREKDGAAGAIRKMIAAGHGSPRIFIFPEGTRSKTGALGPFKSGVFRFACENDGIILPLVIQGSGSVWERRKDSKPCQVHVKILEPFDIVALRKDLPRLEPRTVLLPMVRARMEEEL
ncbi:UvrD-helicase domain-containing protein [uncultured Fibrobacter sp.]|uniref:UvrD-helicase domain-containing protein n=1 Tax=uncultured Fibrobacter sp. TaxID=261512 RepID=UPI00262C9BF8|nr:UvrD-helicase domain-containing protein [uncultured Fibrobacter sp.]